MCLAGEIAAGKSTLAHELVREFPGSAVRAFGDIVRRRAREEGRGQDRAALQELGAELIAHGWSSFVDMLLEGAEAAVDGILIIDGVRHLEAVEEIRRRFPEKPVRVVFLRIDRAMSRARLADRDGEVGGYDHAVEAEVWRLEGMADRCLDGSRPLPEAVDAVRSLMALEME